MNDLPEKKSRLFTFKKFSLSDSHCAMKIGTDGVLLGGFASGFTSSRVLDIGTGCGLIALMIAQKSTARIHAVEIDPEASLQAAENFRNSPWYDRLQVFTCAIQDFKAPGEASYDLIVCNPPFFQNSLQSKTPERSIARHNCNLTFEVLFKSSSYLMAPGAKLIIICPANQEMDAVNSARDENLFLTHKVHIHPNPKHAAKRVICVLESEPINKVKEESMTIETNTRHHFSNTYKKLLEDYHPFL